MALKEYRVEGFKGIDQSRSENQLPSGYSPDAQNMDTENGDLAVAKGYVKHFGIAVPGAGKIRRMYLWHTPDEDRFVVAAGDSIYHYVPADGETPESWETVYTYAVTIASDKWDFEEVRIGTTDYLVIANGQTQLIKWSGSGSAELFGSGSYVYEGAVASVVYNMTKATEATYAESDGVGTYTLTMPSGWAYVQDDEIAFSVPSAVTDATSLKINAGGTDYTADYIPDWEADDVAVVKLTAADACEISQTVYGITSVTLGTAIDADWKQRALDVGVQLDDVTYALSAVDDARTVVTLEEPCTAELTAGDTAKVRGGVSDASVGFIEIHFSRLFAAGDPEHPSRLYWSQPPGDTRTIEDWSMDDASDVASGGFVDVGNTSSDPITGLRSRSTQLLIFKETSLYRLLGDRPSDYRITAVNQDVEKMSNTGCVGYMDNPYWLTRSGMYYHNGQTAVLSTAARQIRTLLADANLDLCKACVNRDKLYFTLRRGSGEYDDSIVVFDMAERTYMLRNGFNVIDICAKDGTMYLVNDSRYVCRWGEGDSYDGAAIGAYWRTPLTDMSNKRSTKALRTLYLRGTGAIVIIEVQLGGTVKRIRKKMPSSQEDVLQVPLKNEGKAFCLTISNEAGGYFRLTGGIEITFEQKED